MIYLISKYEGKLNIWAGISFKGATNVAASNYDLDFKLYQDNDPKHRSLLCTTFLNVNNIVWVIKVVKERNGDWSNL
ncbi:hypothetical protein BpHYR1_049234 [Brachionus plicatilis]|uniref:Uncharacterized protein n=1 Tax=Brachionus plicatilis TaxID=10195 RepID=A0A3M7RXN1_BRAPC|nr:hypothetical protein BpHYR1_049234 [Brachionus plicatilis]